MVGGNFLTRLRGPKELDPVERRRSVRTATVFQLAKISCDGREELCMVRDVSPSGLKAEVYHVPAAGAEVALELKTGHGLEGRVVWADAPFIGVQFAAEMPVQEMLAHCAFDDRLARMRPPRIVTDFAATVLIYGARLEARVTNLSLAGLAVAIDLALPLEATCAIILPGFGPRRAVVRWARDGEAGLQLEEPIEFADFAAWRGAMLAEA